MATTAPPKTSVTRGEERKESPKTGRGSPPRRATAQKPRLPTVVLPPRSPRSLPKSPTIGVLPPVLLALVLESLGAGNAIVAARRDALSPPLRSEIGRRVSRCSEKECARHWRQVFLDYYRAQLERLLRAVVPSDVERMDRSGGYSAIGFGRRPPSADATGKGDVKVEATAAAADERDADGEDEKKTESTTAVAVPRAVRCAPEWCLAETEPIERLLEADINRCREALPDDAFRFHFAFRFNLGLTERRATDPASPTATSPRGPTAERKMSSPSSPSSSSLPEPREMSFDVRFRLHEDEDERKPLQLVWEIEIPRLARDRARLYAFVPTEDALANSVRPLIGRLARETQTDRDADAGRSWIRIGERSGWNGSIFWRAVPIADARETTRQLAQFVRALIYAFEVRTVHVCPEVTAGRHVANDTTLRAYFFQLFAAFPGLDVYVQHTDTSVGRRVARAVAEFPLADIHAVVVREIPR